MVYSVIGSNYGDEGKGLAVDYLASKAESSQILGIRHNGGAQSGHTVEIGDKRFIFHELSSGSFRGADTYWAETFFPDMYKLKDEIFDYMSQKEDAPKIYASVNANITIIDDILINMMLESLRGNNRHGSCGMGINEAALRVSAGYGLSIGMLKSLSFKELFLQLKKIRDEYTCVRLEQIIEELTTSNDDYKVSAIKREIGCSEYYVMLTDDEVLHNYAEVVHGNLEFIEVIEDEEKFLKSYQDIIFEGGQGLMLDEDFEENYPHVTASKTGLYNVCRLLENNRMKPDKVIYVTRSYITKHGAGPLQNENKDLKSIFSFEDNTNVYNEWQGNIRYARHESIEKLLKIIKDDINRNYSTGNCKNDYGLDSLCELEKELFVTHLNETNNRILVETGDIELNEFANIKHIKELFDRIYISRTPFSNDVEILNIN